MTKNEQERIFAAWMALVKVGTKSTSRDALDEGKSYSVKLRIRGTVGKQEIDERISGLLMIGFDSTGTSTSGPEGDHVTALILASVPKTRRAELLAALPEYFTEHGELPEIEEDLLDAITHLRKNLRARSTPTSKRGPVTFSHSAP